MDILSLCVARHTYLIRNYIIDKNALSRVLVLMTSSHAHLALGMFYYDGCFGELVMKGHELKELPKKHMDT